MDLIGKSVVHKSFGAGIITLLDSEFITVDFGEVIKKFQYPGVFNVFMVAEDDDVNIYIDEVIKMVEEEKVFKLKAEEEARERQKVRVRESNRTRTPKGGVSFRERSSSKANPRANIAFKCNFCDGGKSDHQVGYNGVCSDKTMHYNIVVERRSWCSSPDCACMQYSNGEISRKELDDLCSGDGFVCYESQMLRDWRALAGTHLHGDNKGKPRAIKNVQTNSLCVLTTRDPKHSEELRYIFAVFLVDETYEGGGRDEGYVSTESEFKLKLSPYEARSMRFWKYYRNESGGDVIKWGSGLYRYISDKQAAHILKDVAEIKKNTDDEQLADKFYKHFCTINGID